MCKVPSAIYLISVAAGYLMVLNSGESNISINCLQGPSVCLLHLRFSGSCSVFRCSSKLGVCPALLP